MSADLATAVTEACAEDLDGLSVQDLQAHAIALRTAAARLTGRLDEVLGELDARSGGQVIANPASTGPALWTTTRTWWRVSSVISGGAAGRGFRPSGIAGGPRLVAAAGAGWGALTGQTAVRRGGARAAARRTKGAPRLVDAVAVAKAVTNHARGSGPANSARWN